MTDTRAKLILPFAILIAILAVSTSSIFIRFAQNDGVPSLVIAALRLTFATLILTPVALTQHREEIKRFTQTEILQDLGTQFERDAPDLFERLGRQCAA